jgi:hypothetical protein
VRVLWSAGVVLGCLVAGAIIAVGVIGHMWLVLGLGLAVAGMIIWLAWDTTPGHK